MQSVYRPHGSLLFSIIVERLVWYHMWGLQPGHWRSMKPGPTHQGDESRSPQQQSSQWRLLSPSSWHQNCSLWVTAWRMPNSLVCHSTFQIFFLLSTNHIHRCAHKYTHRPAHTGAHPTLTRVRTLHCVLENKELACILFGVNQNVRLKLLFYAFESHTRQTHACLTKLWTSKGIFHRKTHTHTHTHTHQNNRHPQENNTYKPQKDAISTRSIPIKEGSMLEDLPAH